MRPEACAGRGCRLTWGFSPRGDDDVRPYPHIMVDHITPTMSGSEVCVTRFVPGEIVQAEDRWSPEQRVEVEAWVEQLHRMPLEEIP